MLALGNLLLHVTPLREVSEPYGQRRGQHRAGTRMYPAEIRALLRRLAGLPGELAGSLSPHSMRHAFGHAEPRARSCIEPFSRIMARGRIRSGPLAKLTSALPEREPGRYPAWRCCLLRPALSLPLL